MRLVDAIAALLADPADVVLARSILGTTDAFVIADRVERFIAAELACAVVACPFFVQSVGAVFGLDLDDGTRVVLKVHALGDAFRGFTSLDEIGAVYAAQHELATTGLPCPGVRSGPRPFGAGAAAVMRYIDAGVPDDPHAPATRCALAAGLAHVTELGRALDARTRSALPRSRLPPTVFPPPHNALFDLERPGGEWIDERARAARAILDEVDEPLVMHTDFSCANVRVVDGAIAAIFDMDSVAWIDEPRCVANAAVHFTYTGETWRWPSRDEARAFVADYEAARGRAFSATEHRRIDAAMIYAMAYTARCEYGLEAPASPMIDALAAITS